MVRYKLGPLTQLAGQILGEAARKRRPPTMVLSLQHRAPLSARPRCPLTRMLTLEVASPQRRQRQSSALAATAKKQSIDVVTQRRFKMNTAIAPAACFRAKQRVRLRARAIAVVFSTLGRTIPQLLIDTIAPLPHHAHLQRGWVRMAGRSVRRLQSR